MLIMQASSCQSSLLIWFSVFLTFCHFVCHPARSLVMSLNQIWRDGSIEGDLFDAFPYETHRVDICLFWRKPMKKKLYPSNKIFYFEQCGTGTIKWVRRCSDGYLLSLAYTVVKGIIILC